MEMDLSLTELEVDAVLQLIQLSRGSAVEVREVWLKYQLEEEENEENQESEEAAESSSGSGEAVASRFVLDPDEKCFCGEALPRRYSKFGSVLDIYRKTRPMIFKNRARYKRAKN